MRAGVSPTMKVPQIQLSPEFFDIPVVQQRRDIYCEEQFVVKVLDVPVAGRRLQGLSSEDGDSQRLWNRS